MEHNARLNGPGQDDLRRPVILIVTSCFPFNPGEQFLESEMPYWRDATDARVVLLPMSATGTPRPLPEGIVVSTVLSDHLGSKARKVIAVLKALGSEILWAEFSILRRQGKLDRKRALGALKAVAGVQLLKVALREAMAVNAADLIYTYWFAHATYAALILPDRPVVVTRAHGADLYEIRTRHAHMFLREQLGRRLDLAAPISQDGVRHLANGFAGIPSVKLSRLGVTIPPKPSPLPPTDTISLVSISFCVPVKNIDKIITAVQLLQKRQPHHRVIWRHIGDGACRKDLEQLARNVFEGTSVDWKFLGALDNSDVLRYLDMTPIDAILNASSSEGIPVSIMEAMARGIPAVAPDVGGISEIVAAPTGILLGPAPSAEQIAEAISENLKMLKSKAMRETAAASIKSAFDKDVNYRSFVTDLTELAEARAVKAAKCA